MLLCEIHEKCLVTTSNWLLLNEQFHSLRMDENTKASDHLNTLNSIVSEL